MQQSFIAKDIDNTLGQISPNYVVASFDLQSTLHLWRDGKKFRELGPIQLCTKLN